MSDFAYEFDLKSSESAINSVGVIPGGVSIKTTDKSPTGSMYQILVDELQFPLITPYLDAKMYWLKHGQTSPKTFPIQLQFTGIDTDIVAGVTALSFVPPIQDTINVRTFYPDIDASEIVFRVNSTNYGAYPMGDMLYDYVRRLDMSDGNVTVYGSGDADGNIANGSLFAGFPTTGMLAPIAATDTTQYAFVNTNVINSIRQDDTIRSKVVSAAAAEGAVFGSAFSVNFYMNRMRTNVNVELSNSDLKAIKYVKLDRQVNAVNVFLNTQIYSSGFQALPGNSLIAPDPVSGVQIGYILGTQFVGLDLQAHAPQFNRGNWSAFSGATTTRVINADATGIDITTGLIVALGAKAYSQAFSAYQVDGVPTKLEMTVLGVDKVHPYHAVVFDSTTPKPFVGKTVRPSSIKYNFKDDTATITAYQII